MNATMDDEALLENLSAEAFERLEKVGSDPLRLTEPWKTILLIYSAQGVIDNGGFAYFFENDWPHHTPYDEFASAYDRIGEPEVSKAIRNAVAAMGLANPETRIDDRRAYIENNTIDQYGAVAGWIEDAIVGNESVMSSLASWIRSQNQKT